MARSADFTVIKDTWMALIDRDTVEFEVPSNLHTGSYSVLSFMVDANNLGRLTLKIRLNGIEVWNWVWADSDDHPVHLYQEVVAPGVVRAGQNVLSIDGSSEDGAYVRFSDIVLWWRGEV